MKKIFVFVLLIVFSGCFLRDDGTIEIIEDFHMNALDRDRDIILYFPPDYDENTEKRYPVLYMHDGQNLFDAATSYAGEWGVDETMARLFARNVTDGVIVVGIYNGLNERSREYLPWEQPDGMGGDADKYMDFIVHDLKPYIDDTYRTKPERENTGLMGSSFGGVISFYGGLQYQEVFSKIGAMSTSFWIGDYKNGIDEEGFLNYLQNIDIREDMKIYLDCGNLEGDAEDNGNGYMVNDMIHIYEGLLEKGHPEENIMMVVDKDGKHMERYWKKRFPKAFLWLYER